LLSVVLIQGWWANPIILFSGNPAAWTLTVEAFFYALFPWFSTWFMKVRVRGALLLALGAIAWAFGYRAGVTLWPESWLTHVPLPVIRVPEFLLGMAIAWAMRCGWRPRVPAMVGLLSVAGVVLLIASENIIAVAFANEYFTVAVGLAIATCAAQTLRGRRSWLEGRWQVKLGEWSFAFYLVHATVIYLALRVFGFQAPSWGNLIWFAVILAIDVALAWALHSIFERPIERRMRRWKDARDQKLRATPVG
jgi:peptidoglycan/LPS O-acetylase OafA/YrhL